MKEPIAWFEELTAIPRASGDEARACDYLERFATERGLFFRRDALNNAVIKKSASPGARGEAVMLQAHLDIVPVKDEGIEHDFAKDPVTLIKEGDIWRADGTTLGADNALGVALMLALLNDEKAFHPALECVFTTQEETGLFGAAALDVSDLRATKMINLDCGGEGHFTTSCAGGLRAGIKRPVCRAAAPGNTYQLEVSGLTGGHSGGNIHMGRANALKLLVRALDRLFCDLNALPVCLRGGDKDNVIPSYAAAEFVCASDPAEAVRALNKSFQDEFSAAEPELSLTVTPCATKEEPLAKDDARAALSLMLLAPYGPRALIAGQDMVETSANLGTASLAGDELSMTVSIRSSQAHSKHAVLRELTVASALCGAQLSAGGDYPGWPYAQISPLREAIAKVYRAHSGAEAKFSGIHAGLECGLFMDKMPGLDAIAMGADSGGAHTTKEWMSVSSLARTHSFLKALLAELAKE